MSGLAGLLALLAGSVVAEIVSSGTLARLGSLGRLVEGRLLGGCGDCRRATGGGGGFGLELPLDLAEGDAGGGSCVLWMLAGVELGQCSCRVSNIHR